MYKNLQEKGFSIPFILLSVLLIAAVGSSIFLLSNGKLLTQKDNSQVVDAKDQISAETKVTGNEAEEKTLVEQSQNNQIVPTLTLNNTRLSIQPSPTISSCSLNDYIWQYLPQKVREDINWENYTYEVGEIEGSTYFISALDWSPGCNFRAVYVELVGRGSDAYKPSDFEPRGLYMFNSNTKEMKTVFLLEENAYIDLYEYESGYWDEPNKYVFIAITSKKESVFTGRRYVYDTETGQLAPKGEDL